MTEKNAFGEEIQPPPYTAGKLVILIRYQVNSRFILQEDFNRIRTRNNLQPNTNLIKEANPSSNCKLDLPLNLDLIQQMSLVHNVKAWFKPKPNQNHHLQLISLS